MPHFKITKAKGAQALGTVEADDEGSALDVFAMKCGFWDFEDLAASMELTVVKAREGLTVRPTAGPGAGSAPKPIPELEVM